MSTSKKLTNSLLLSKFTSAVAYRERYVGDLNDAPTGAWLIREESQNANMPIPASGHLNCVMGDCSIQRFTTASNPIREFVRTRWYNNNWIQWREVQTLPISGGGDKSLPLNHLRNLAERRVA